LEALESLFNRIGDMHQLSVIREMWCVGPEESIDLGWRLLTRSTPVERVPEVVAHEIEKTFDGIDRALLVALAEYTTRIDHDTGRDLSASVISHQLMLASLDPGASRLMGSSLVRNLESALAIKSDRATDEEEAGVGDLLDSMVSAMRNVMAAESADQLQEIDSLQSRIEELEAGLERSGARQSRTETANEQLRRGYRLPEQLVEARGQKKVLEEIAKYHQELEHASSAGNLDRETIDWLLRLLENTESQFHVERVGSPGDTGIFDPDIHIYRAGEEGDGGQVLLESSGLVWNDPSGERIVLSRAHVKPF
jgi:molecular chaperone GrpE (heat shock protein)